MGSCSASVEGDSRLLINSSATDVLRSGNASLCFGPKKLLSLVTFFAWDQSKALKRQLWSTAKKVTPAPGRGALIDRRERNQTTQSRDAQTERLAPQRCKLTAWCTKTIRTTARPQAKNESQTPANPSQPCEPPQLAYPLQKNPRHQISAAFQKQRNQSHIRQGGNQK